MGFELGEEVFWFDQLVDFVQGVPGSGLLSEFDFGNAGRLHSAFCGQPGNFVFVDF